MDAVTIQDFNAEEPNADTLLIKRAWSNHWMSRRERLSMLQNAGAVTTKKDSQI